MEDPPPCPDCNGKSKRRVGGFRCLSCNKIWPEKIKKAPKGFLALGVEILYFIFLLLVFLIAVAIKISN